MKMAAQTTCGMTVATVGAVVIAYYMFTKISRKRMPPGPTPLPFVGKEYLVLCRGGQICQ